MTWLALTWIALAFALWRYGQRHTDDFNRLFGFTLALVCVLAGLVAAPMALKMVVLTALIVYPSCLPSDRVLKPSCPKFCLLRHQCRNPP
ncbi:hypothetical protein [Nodosilinea nodulosa]|uniref:hypothetical protein n=1 Tax=Nodosilinea nodulosa TaxID=416001 RepID=UPI0002E603CB|nr:hypothetical protein [Nodosilinea nodulosa]